MPYSRELNPTFTNKIPGSTKAIRTFHKITHNPSSASPREILYIVCPKLSTGIVLVPNTLNLVFDLNLPNTVVQNMSKNLISKCILKYQSEVLFESTGPQLIETYRDLYKDRKDDILYGIQSENLRKVRSGTAEVAPGSDDELLHSVYKKKYAIKLNHPMITDHGCASPSALKDIEWELTLTDPQFIMQGDGKYELTNIHLEYETITDNGLATAVAQSYATKSFFYEHATCVRTTTWKQSGTLLNETINIPRRSLKGILILFTMTQEQDNYDSEQFINPKITKVNIQFEGAANRVFAQGYEARDLWREARRYFAQEDTEMSEAKFLRDKFCLFIDLRSFQAIHHHGQGLKVVGTQDGILLEIKKEDTSTDKDLNIYAHIYALSDAQLSINPLLKSIMY